MRERMRSYELMFIISPLHATDEEVAAVIQRLQNSVETEGGEVTSINHRPPWGRRRLAYPIRAYSGGEASRRSFTDGFYVLMHFVLSSAKLVDIERTIKFTDHILRHLITIVEKKASETSPAADDKLIDDRYNDDDDNDDDDNDEDDNDNDGDDNDDDDDDDGDDGDDDDDDDKTGK